MSGRVLDRRVWLAAGVAAALLMVVVAWLLVISPSRADTQQLREDTANVAQQNAVLAGKTAALRKEAERRDEIRDDLEQRLTELPAETRLPELSRQLASQARSHDVEVVSINVGTPAPPSTDTGTGTTTATAASVLVIPVTVVSEGPALQQLRFLRDVQRVGPRRALVTDSSLNAKDTKSVRTSSTLTVQLQVFTSSMSAEARAELAKLLGQDAPD